MKMEVVNEKKIVPKKKQTVKKTTTSGRKRAPKKTTTLTKPKQEIAVQSETGALLKMAINKDLDIEKLEKLIELKNRGEERACKKDFETHFSLMQADFPPVKRSKEGYGYNYTPLEVMQKNLNPIISKHGFSYKWSEDSIPEGKKITLIISGWGHSESTSFDVPALQPTKQQNAVQVLGSMSTYGKRYTFVSGFGVTIEDEDDDAASLTFDDGVQYAEPTNWISTCKTLEDLSKTWSQIWTQTEGDKIGREILTIVKDKKKKELSK